MKNLSFILIMLFFYSCENGCYINAQKFKKEEYHFKLTNKKDTNIYNIFIGTSYDSRIITWKAIGHSDIFQEAEIGDSILKDTGNTSVYLWKHRFNKIKEFEFICQDILYE